MKKITLQEIRDLSPCYDPSKYLPENWEGTVIDILNVEQCPATDRFWVVLREDFIDAKKLLLFAVWCARGALKLVPNPDTRSIEACDVAERYANGEATKEELDAASDAARAASDAASDAARAASDAASDAAWAASDAAWAAREAASEAAREAASDAARAAASDAAWAASEAAREAASDAAWAASEAAREAASDAAWAASEAASDAAREAQISKLKEMLT